MKLVNSVSDSWKLYYETDKKDTFSKAELFEILDAIHIGGAEQAHQLMGFIVLYMNKNGIEYYNRENHTYNDAFVGQIYNEWQSCKNK